MFSINSEIPMLVKIFATLSVLLLCGVESFSIHRVSNMVIKLDDAVSEAVSDGDHETLSVRASRKTRNMVNPFTNSSTIPSFDDSNINVRPFGETFNIKFSALDADLDMDLEIVDSLIADDAQIVIPQATSDGETVMRKVVNNIYSKTHTDSEGNEFSIVLSVFSSTNVSGYVTKNGVDYKFTPLLNMRKEIKAMSTRFKNQKYADQLAELDSIFGPESPSDANEMVLVDLTTLPDHPLNHYQSDPANLGYNSTDCDSEEAYDPEAPNVDFHTDSSSTERTPLALTQWPKHCHPYVTGNKPGDARRYGVVDISVDYSAFSYYNSFIDHPHLNKDEYTREIIVTTYILTMLAKANYYFDAQVAFTHRAKQIVVFRKPSMINHFTPALVPLATQLLCPSSAAANGPLCQVTSDQYLAKLITLRPLWGTFAQNTPPEFTPSTTLIAFTGLYTATSDALSTPDSYAKASKQYESVSLIPVLSPKPYNTLAKMLGNQMGARATNTPANFCYTKGPNYLSGVMGDANGVINSESLDAGEIGFAKGCQFTEMCDFLKDMFVSTDTLPNTIRNVNYHYERPICGNFKLERTETCEKMIDPVCCDSNCFPKYGANGFGARCWSGDPQCCVGCTPEPNTKVCYTDNGVVGVCGAGGYCRPSHCSDYNPDFVPCVNVGNPCEETCKHKNAADSTCIALPTDVRNGDECKISPTSSTMGVCFNKQCQTPVYKWAVDKTRGLQCTNNVLWEFVYCGDQSGNIVNDYHCENDPNLPDGVVGPCIPPNNSHDL